MQTFEQWWGENVGSDTFDYLNKDDVWSAWNAAQAAQRERDAGILDEVSDLETAKPIVRDSACWIAVVIRRQEKE